MVRMFLQMVTTEVTPLCTKFFWGFFKSFHCCPFMLIECQGVTLSGKQMDDNFSKHAQINPSPDTTDFSSSPLNRFNRNAAKNYHYCCAPTKMIHVSSLPANITKEDITAHLSPHGNIIN
jgi:hypothetical protein